MRNTGRRPPAPASLGDGVASERGGWWGEGGMVRGEGAFWQDFEYNERTGCSTRTTSPRMQQNDHVNSLLEMLTHPYQPAPTQCNRHRPPATPHHVCQGLGYMWVWCQRHSGRSHGLPSTLSTTITTPPHPHVPHPLAHTKGSQGLPGSPGALWGHRLL